MNVTKMFQMQKELDDRIRKEHGLMDEDLIDKKILAFQVELAELANETRCFKYWSLKPPSDRAVILEEYVDGLHFLLSIGLETSTTNVLDESFNQEKVSLTDQFATLFEVTSQFRKTKSEKQLSILFQQYIYLGSLLHFTILEIETAYVGKNEVNHERQDKGY
ncbi:dUTPase [Anaerobacillus alkaliphilus]|uniref:dUTPase n=1 Tax=Anaerobacillus alkaliphilus TaxID=1548597 RepID=A0A4Q0VQM2_9BACI|nr:dUTP diphosphatase [Anaerobacillus alkaliphilus]RXI98499.1 dUTPase [Anaerobacillus alkaliphilus]